MENTPVISIIIPTFNRANLIQLTLSSIRAQNFKDWECIIVDDGSEDDTVNIINSYILNDSRFKLFSRPFNYIKGPSSCRNFGFNISKGSYIQFFDSDDIMLPNMLKNKIAPFSQIENLGFSSCGFNKIYGKGKIQQNSLSTPDNNLPLLDQVITYKIPFGTPIPLWSRDVLAREPKLFDTNLIQSEDLELYSRLLNRHGRIKSIFLEEALFHVRMHSDSISQNTNKRNFSKNIKDVVEVYQKICERQTVMESSKIFMLKETVRFLKIALYERDHNLAQIILLILDSGVYNIKNQFKFKLLKSFAPIFVKTGRGVFASKWLFNL